MIAALDCGLSSLKISVIDETGATIETIAERYPTFRSGPRAEQDPADWWRALTVGMRKLQSARAIEAIAPTGHMHGLVLLDKRNEPLLPCLTLHDRRGAASMEALDASELYETTGQTLDPALPLAKLLWLRANDPQTLARAGALLAPKDYLRLRLTGAHGTDHTDAAGTGLYDLRERSWSVRLLELSGLPDSALVPISDSLAAAPLRDAAAAELGLTPGIPVITGAGDDVELLGASAHQAGVAVEHFGTTGSILLATKSEVHDPDHRVELSPTCTSATFAAGASTSNAGSVIEWLNTRLGVSLDEAITAIDGHLTALPFLFGERGTERAASASIFGIDGDTSNRQIARAFLVGVAFGLRELTEAVAARVGPISRVITSGGGAAPPEWVRLRATCYGSTVTVLAGDPTALGCAALAFAALSEAAPEDVSRSFRRAATEVEPDESASAAMNEQFARYQQMKATAQIPTVHEPMRTSHGH